MGRAPCCDKTKVKRGPWSPDEDATLKNYVETYGTGGNWIAFPQKAGLQRCGKSCRLRWLNYLRPNIKHGGFTEEEDTIILSLYHTIGSRWSVIASQLPGRTDNDVKNYWNTKLKKKLLAAAAPAPKPSYPSTVTVTGNYFGNYISSSSNISPNISTTVDDMQLPCFPVDTISKQETMLMGVDKMYNNNTGTRAYSPSLSTDNGSGTWTTSSSANNGSLGEDDALFLAGLMSNYDIMNSLDGQEMGYGRDDQMYPDFGYSDFLIGQQFGI